MILGTIFFCFFIGLAAWVYFKGNLKTPSDELVDKKLDEQKYNLVHFLKSQRKPKGARVMVQNRKLVKTVLKTVEKIDKNNF